MQLGKAKVHRTPLKTTHSMKMSLIDNMRVIGFNVIGRVMSVPSRLYLVVVGNDVMIVIGFNIIVTVT